MARKKVTNEQLNQIKQLYLQGNSIKQISEETEHISAEEQQSIVSVVDIVGGLPIILPVAVAAVIAILIIRKLINKRRAKRNI